MNWEYTKITTGHQNSDMHKVALICHGVTFLGVS